VTVIFQGTKLRLNFHPCNSDVTFVLFGDAKQNGHQFETSQFIECEPGAISQLGYNEFIVDTSGNHWYQTDEIIEVIRLIKEHNPAGAKIVTYGTGMGAYASINFSEMLDAHRYIAICPQFSLHPSHRPLEDSRWWAESKLLNFNHDYIHSGMIRDRRGYIFYDKASLDVHHAVSILNNTAGIGFHVPLFGHAAGRVMDQAYGLQEIMKEVAQDEFDPVKFHSDFKVGFVNAVPTLAADLENNAPLNEKVPKILEMNDLDSLIEQAYESDNAQDKRIALLSISLAENKDADAEDIRTKKIGLLLELNLQREAILEIMNSRLPRKETAEQLLSQYQDLSELARLLPLLKFHPVVFRDAAFKCAKSTPERALILMKYALKSRPDNQLIKNKVIEYQKLVHEAKKAPESEPTIT